jgi:thiamine monophosphate kinase
MVWIMTLSGAFLKLTTTRVALADAQHRRRQTAVEDPEIIGGVLGQSANALDCLQSVTDGHRPALGQRRWQSARSREMLTA